MGKFGWSMPAGAWESTLPGEEPELIRLRCALCGAFLPSKPDSQEPWEDFPYAAGYYLKWDCRKCGRKVRINDMDTGFYNFDGKAYPYACEILFGGG